MGKVKNVSKKSTKSKAKEKKELAIVPRLRLEPRLTTESSERKERKQNEDTDTSSRFLAAEEINENNLQEELLQKDSCEKVKSVFEQSEIFDAFINSSVGENTNCKTQTEDAQSSLVNVKSKVPRDLKSPIKRRKRLVCKGNCWNDRELMDLAIGLQSEGFADLKKVADYLKTKNENSINLFIKARSLDTRKDKNKQRGRPLNKWSTVSPENIETWPNVRKWRRLAYDQMLMYTRSKDYSKPVITALCKRFYEEEKEPDDPQVINVKLIYKYLMDCMAGQVPPQLPPKESALVLDLLREVRLMPIVYDFDEERKFLHDFKEATNFKPFQVKDEFKKRFRKESDDDILGPNTVAVPEQVFMDLSRHKKLVQSFNPLVTPVWMLQKEQEFLEKYSEELNVYFD